VSDASVFRAVLTYTPPTLINYTTPIELSLFMADPNGNALALVDYMGASPTAITANDLASLAAGQKYGALSLHPLLSFPLSVKNSQQRLS
jgi:hypothetical protein